MSIPLMPGLPVLGNLLQFRRDRLAVQATAAQIGPIVRLQFAHIPVYLVTCADLAHEVFVAQAASFKKSAALEFLEPLLGRGLLTAEGETHKRHRKLLAPAFAPKRLAAYGDTMIAETRTQIARWQPGDRIDIAAEMMELTLAIAGKTLFGVDVRSEARTVSAAVELAMRAQAANVTSPIRLGYRWPLPRHRRMRRAVATLDEIVYRLIADGRRLGTDRGDVLSMLLLARDESDGVGLDDRQVRDEVMTLLLAGHETTANALTWTWYELGRNPNVLVRLEDELRRVVGDRPVTIDDLPNLPWNLAVIEESMRLHPPAYLTGRQTMHEVELGGHRLPEGTFLAIGIYAIQRRPEYFAAPLAFKPERMLAEVKKARPRHHYLPFGAGPRVCIGSHFALLETQLCMATMIQGTRLRPLASTVEAEPLITLRPRGGLPAIVDRVGP
jgi:cytochrome P450